MLICVAGKNNIAVDILDFILNKKYAKENICIIPNRTDSGEDTWQKSLIKKAKDNDIKIKKIEDLYEIENLLFLSLEFDKIIQPDRFKSKLLFNIHFSLLPKYRGMYTSVIPILQNEKITGVTLHKIDRGIDTGDIISQKKFKIDIMDNARDLYFKYIRYGTELVKNFLESFFRGEPIISKPQNYKFASYFSKSYIDFGNIMIDLNKTAIEIHNQIRAFNFREYQIPEVYGYPIISSKISNYRSMSKPSSIIFENDICIMLSTIDYNIILFKDKVKDMFYVCENGLEKELNKLLLIPKIINVQNSEGITPLITAIKNNQKNVVENLLMKGADLSIADFKGKTCLMYAVDVYVQKKDPYILNLLLNMGIDIYQKDYSKKNIFDYCIENNYHYVLDIINKHIYR